MRGRDGYAWGGGVEGHGERCVHEWVCVGGCGAGMGGVGSRGWRERCVHGWGAKRGWVGVGV